MVSTQYLHSIYTVDTQYVSTVCREELLYLLNLKVLGRVKVRQPVAGDQGWINEVYLWEKFNIGLEYNLRTGVVQVSNNLAPRCLSIHADAGYERLDEERLRVPLRVAVQARPLPHPPPHGARLHALAALQADAGLVTVL